MCDVCGKSEVLGVAAALGPVSVAYCADCLKSGAYPWWNIVGYLFTTYEDLAPWAEEMLQVNLKFHNKTREEFEQECEAVWKEYIAHMDAMENENLEA